MVYNVWLFWELCCAQSCLARNLLRNMWKRKMLKAKQTQKAKVVNPQLHPPILSSIREKTRRVQIKFQMVMKVVVMFSSWKRLVGLLLVTCNALTASQGEEWEHQRRKFTLWATKLFVVLFKLRILLMIILQRRSWRKITLLCVFILRVWSEGFCVELILIIR